ncbi:DUF1566 domain-containing protein [Sandaracinomonas limnophila]|uniref:DUF1566 domain-containing protein n=1 Tax=Sandaracinomonas limnophila TaxID=1862386 RepID=A0A437PTM0_9BACT|nr:DUF1566 domain-containing protein [Sandaracinomonas limnophila]RVU25570.1 DUF1566 domain-containing protein [Sandaracinomonas limnophila]
MKKILVSFLLIFSFCISTMAQEADKTVSIIVSGSGKTQEEAKQQALRSAIEQAFGAFISSKTEILNDKLVADQISSVSSGNIQSFTILNESQLPDGGWGLTLNAVVSVTKLISFSEAKGLNVEFKGALFTINIKQQLLNEQAEINVVSEMFGFLHENMQKSFDFSVQTGEPKSLDEKSEKWEIPMIISSTANKNMDFCANYFIKTLAAIGLTENEVLNYKNLNKPIYSVIIKYQGVEKTIYLRRKVSFGIIRTLASQWDFYKSLFQLESNVESTLFPIPKNSINLPSGREGISIRSNFAKYNEWNRASTREINFNFLTNGELASNINHSYTLTIDQVNKLNGFKVIPRGVVSNFKQGGLVIFEKEGHGLVTSILDLGVMKWKEANSACNELISNGFDDWRLPNKNELDSIINYYTSYGLGFLRYYEQNGDTRTFNSYWSSTQADRDYFIYINTPANRNKFNNTDSENLGYLFIAVRTF